MTLAVAILAGGASDRMGTCKALVEIEGRAAVLRLLRAAASIASDTPVLVVTGAHDAQIRAALSAQAAGAEVVRNPAWQAGRTSSIQVARRNRPQRDLVIAPVDHPLVGATTFTALERAWRDAGCPARGWLAPRVERAGGSSAFGHPVVIGRDLLEGIDSLEPDTPLRSLRADACPLLSVPADERVLANLDTPADLERFSGPEKR